VKVVDSKCVPAFSSVPADGEYANDPSTPLVALSCDAPSGVP
jgi:hypothetical protein